MRPATLDRLQEQVLWERFSGRYSFGKWVVRSGNKIGSVFGTDLHVFGRVEDTSFNIRHLPSGPFIFLGPNDHRMCTTVWSGFDRWNLKDNVLCLYKELTNKVTATLKDNKSPLYQNWFIYILPTFRSTFSLSLPELMVRWPDTSQNI